MAITITALKGRDPFATGRVAVYRNPEFFLPDTGLPVWTAPAVLFTDAAYINAPATH